MQLNDKQFYVLFGEATVSHDRDTYIAEWSTSSEILGDDPGECPDPDWGEIVDLLGNLWDVSHMTIRDIRASTGLSQAGFATRFCIPLRTVENWEAKGANSRECPIYVHLMLADLCGLLTASRRS